MAEFRPGDTFINASVQGVSSRLWVIVSNPRADADKILIVNLTSSRLGRDEDSACVLQSGEHPFVRHRSYVFFEGARITSLKTLEVLLRRGDISFMDRVTGELLDKIRMGLMASSHSCEYNKQLLRDQALVPEDTGQ